LFLAARTRNLCACVISIGAALEFLSDASTVGVIRFFGAALGQWPWATKPQKKTERQGRQRRNLRPLHDLVRAPPPPLAPRPIEQTVRQIVIFGHQQALEIEIDQRKPSLQTHTVRLPPFLMLYAPPHRWNAIIDATIQQVVIKCAVDLGPTGEGGSSDDGVDEVGLGVGLGVSAVVLIIVAAIVIKKKRQSSYRSSVVL